MVKNFSWLGVVFWAFTVSGCSYLKKKALDTYLSQFQDKKAEQVQFEELPPDYSQQAHPTLDALWWNDSLKTSISYFSSCSKALKNLEGFQTSSYPLRYKRIHFFRTDNSLYSVLEVPQARNQKTYMAIYTIQKKHCYFNINLVAGSLFSFEKAEPLFKKFIKSFNYK